MLKILKILKKTKKNNMIKLTIPEGNNIKQTADIISKIINIDKKKFIEIANNKKLEGYLMPETYFINSKTNEEQIIEIMYNEFNKKITPDIKRKIKKMNTTLNNIIIIASIIEKEAVLDEERQIIASVFYNRLKNKMKLQSCSTVLYAIGSVKNKLSIEDTKFNSPYNTYIHSGLPPGPISNPGMKSINAAINPSNTDYLFFVSIDNNSHMFAKKYSDHINNKKMIELMNIKGHVYVA
jgi:UPF0755 protein